MERMSPRELKTTSLRHSAITIRDVAREAHVALGTASRVLTGAPNVRPETRSRVLAVAERLGYRPNPMARALAKGKTNTLGVLAPFFFTRQNYVETVRGIQAGIAEYDYSLVIYSVDRPEQVRTHLSTLGRGPRIDGLIVVALDASLLGDDVLPKSFPTLCVDTLRGGLPSLLPHHEHGGYYATRHLIGHGHTEIAFVDRPQDPVSHASSAARRLGFMQAYDEAGLTPRASTMVIEDYTAEGGYVSARRLLDLSTPPTAFVCASDLQAIGVMRAARELGLRVGSDIAIVGYNDVGIAEYLGLSTVHVPSFEIGREAVGELLAILDGSSADREPRYIEPRLVARTSCGCGE
jgi:DNA-binding LacI/PurR family transcriptional regulator